MLYCVGDMRIYYIIHTCRFTKIHSMCVQRVCMRMLWERANPCVKCQRRGVVRNPLTGLCGRGARVGHVRFVRV